MHRPAVTACRWWPDMKTTDIALLAASAAAVFLVFKAKNGGLSWVPWNKVASYDGWEYFNDGQAGIAVKYGADGQPAEYYLNGERIWYRGMA